LFLASGQTRTPIGVTISSKVGNAIARSRVKRWTRGNTRWHRQFVCDTWVVCRGAVLVVLVALLCAPFERSITSL
jgi:ribonuclease P protein component